MNAGVVPASYESSRHNDDKQDNLHNSPLSRPVTSGDVQVGYWLGMRLMKPYEIKYIASPERDQTFRDQWQANPASLNHEMIDAYFGDQVTGVLLRQTSVGVAHSAFAAVHGYGMLRCSSLCIKSVEC